MPRHAEKYRGLAQTTRLKVLDAVIARPGIGVAELADLTGLHQNTLREHVRVLEATGLLRSRSEHRGTRGRPRTVLTAVRGDEPDEAADRRVLEAMRHGDLHRRLLPAGSEVGPAADTAALHQLDALYWHLDGLGLQPELDEAELTAHLVPCPFDSLVAGAREVACRVHETLIRDVLVRAGGPLEVDSVQPYATPQECRVHLRRRHDVPSPAPSAKRARTEALSAAASTRDTEVAEEARSDLMGWCERELLPHALAEEHAMYPPAQSYGERGPEAWRLSLVRTDG